MNTRWKSLAIPVLWMLLVWGPRIVYAFSTPTPSGNTAFAYDIYFVSVMNMLKGPVGYVAVVAIMAYGALMAIRAELFPAVLAILAGAVLIKMTDILSSMGLLF